MGIEPTSSAWKAEVLPLNYTRLFQNLSNHDSLYKPDPKLIRLAPQSDQTFALYSAYKNPDSPCLLKPSGYHHSLSVSSRCRLLAEPSQPHHHLVEGVGFEPT